MAPALKDAATQGSGRLCRSLCAHVALFYDLLDTRFFKLCLDSHFPKGIDGWPDIQLVDTTIKRSAGNSKLM
jgi:hypothetical protein